MDLKLAFHGLKQPTLAVVAGEAAEEPALGLLDERSLALLLPENVDGEVHARDGRRVNGVPPRPQCRGELARGELLSRFLFQ
jgi:hypothetical protein